MAEPLSELLRLRITPSQRQQLNEAAALAGLSPSEYARRLFADAQTYQAELMALRYAVEQLLEQKSRAIELETLLLLRSTLKPEQVRQVHQHMSGLGYLPTNMEI
ncbi:hypothetical protein KOE80_04555 [Alcaligenes sp. 13f]|uniref:plasmid mobilization protein n=1 Tax=Alcaligenes sp. 13f TaxID=2841924 RepID=UPI001CF66DA3|nr:hypothetical protein [Alcaligenes sp. 13f]MCB4321475.1 hypothetical protein [Alcaligenes sp. 13f]